MSEIRECPLTLKVWIYFVQSQNKLLPDSTLMSKNQKALALNPFQDEEPISLIGSIKYNWYNNILSLGSKNYQRKLWHFFFLCSSFFFFFGGWGGGSNDPCNFIQPWLICGARRGNVTWDHLRRWFFFETASTGRSEGKFENMSTSISASNITHESKGFPVLDFDIRAFFSLSFVFFLFFKVNITYIYVSKTEQIELFLF